MSNKQELIALFDADSFIYIACHNKKDAPIKSLEDCIKHVDSLLNDILSNVGASSFLLFLTIGKCFRYDLDPDYKKSRIGKDKPEFFSEVRQHLLDKWKALAFLSFEADDCCATVAKRFENSVIVSADRDLLEREGTHYNCRTGEWVITTHEEAEYKFWGDCIEGQSGDSIQGLKGKGRSFVDQLFRDQPVDKYPELVFGAYCRYYKNSLIAIRELGKTYQLLHIVDDIPDFPHVQPIPVQLPELNLPDFNIQTTLDF